MKSTPGSDALWPLVVYAAAVFVVVGGMIGLSYVLGQRHKDKDTDAPYESGISATGSARLRFSPRFYVIAMLFVIFDVEAVFIIAWAVSLRRAGWGGYLAMLFFVGVLLSVLVYEIRSGAFDIALKGKDVLRKQREIARSGAGK